MKESTYDRRKAEGKCVNCGLPLPPRWGWVCCMECRNAKLKRERERTEEKRKPKNILPPHVKTLDEMSVESKDKHLTYGQLQAAELIAKMRGENI